ncbi:MAG TPA: pyridoxamine 5'-phosphate oxidase family protein [Candidatus Paceibacterota bacterium]
MQKEIIDFINSQKICVLAVEMMDGAPHGATAHFAMSEDPLTFFFETYREYRKCEALFGREVSRATVVIGVDESISQTLQMDGEVCLIKSEEKELYDKVYFEKFPKKLEKSKDPKFVFFSFTPKRWQYTDFKGPNGKLILTSDDK